MLPTTYRGYKKAPSNIAQILRQMQQFSADSFIMRVRIAEVALHIRKGKRGINIILSPRTIRQVASPFDIPEVKRAISIDNKWTEPLFLIWEWKMSPLITLFALCTPLNVIDGNQKKGRFVRETNNLENAVSGLTDLFHFPSCEFLACRDRVSLQKGGAVLMNVQELPALRQQFCPRWVFILFQTLLLSPWRKFWLLQ